MDGKKLWMAAEIELMAPDERYRLFDERAVTDVSSPAPDYLARIRAKGRALRLASGVVDGFAGARMLIASGLMVRALVVYGLLLDDDSIELVGLDLDTT